MMKGSTVTLQDDEPEQIAHSSTKRQSIDKNRQKDNREIKVTEQLNSKLQSVQEMERNLKRESERMRREYEMQLRGNMYASTTNTPRRIK